MMFSDLPPGEFSLKYGIELHQWQCPQCNHVYNVNVPVYMEGLAGFMSPIHGCGPMIYAFLGVPMSTKAREKWRGVDCIQLLPQLWQHEENWEGA